MTDLKKFKIKNQNLRDLFFSVITVLATLLVLSFIAALILSAAKSNSKDIRLYSLAVLIASAFLSGFINSKLRSVKHGIFAALFIVLMMLLLGIILSVGKLSGGAFMNYGCFFLVSCGSAYLGKRRAKKQRRHKR